MNQVEVTTSRTFEAAHSLPGVPDDHKCKRLHGHNYRIEVAAVGPVNEITGMVVDYAILDALLDELVVNVCDHRHLNKIEGLENPTGENIATWIMTRLMTTIIPVKRVTVWETPHYSATVRRPPHGEAL